MIALISALRLLGLWIATAGALYAWSELVFLNEGPIRALLSPGGVSHALAMWGFYLVPAALWLALLRLRWPERWWQAILAGCFVGWAIEGAMVPAIFEAPPFSFLWTSLAWHAPIDVFLGLWVLPRLLASDRSRWALPLLLAPVAVAAGLWALWTRGTHFDALNLAPMTYALVLIIATPLIALGAWGMAIWGRDVERLPKWLAWGAILAVTALGVLQIAAYGLAAPLWLPILVGLIALVAWAWNRPGPNSEAHRAQNPVLVTGRLLWLALLPLLASPAYAFFSQNAGALETELISFFGFSTGMCVVFLALLRGFTHR